jgi:hypothetical protein
MTGVQHRRRSFPVAGSADTTEYRPVVSKESRRSLGCATHTCRGSGKDTPFHSNLRRRQRMYSRRQLFRRRCQRGMTGDRFSCIDVDSRIQISGSAVLPGVHVTYASLIMHQSTREGCEHATSRGNCNFCKKSGENETKSELTHAF